MPLFGQPWAWNDLIAIVHLEVRLLVEAPLWGSPKRSKKVGSEIGNLNTQKCLFAKKNAPCHAWDCVSLPTLWLCYSGTVLMTLMKLPGSMKFHAWNSMTLREIHANAVLEKHHISSRCAATTHFLCKPTQMSIIWLWGWELPKNCSAVINQINQREWLETLCLSCQKHLVICVICSYYKNWEKHLPDK
jgi:hypothetical protein